MTEALRSEWMNVRSTPTAWVLLAASMVMAAVSFSANIVGFETDELQLRETLAQLMHASTVATLTFAMVAGIVGATSDVRFGRIDQLLLTEPRTSAVVTPKAVAGFGLGLIYGLAGSVVALIVTSLWYRAKNVPVDLTSATVTEPLIGAIVGSGLFCVLGIGLGMAVRNQPLALGAGLVMLLIVQPPLLIGLPEVGRWLPGAAGLAITLSPDPELVGQLPGAVLLFVWAALFAAVGAQRLRQLRAT